MRRGPAATAIAVVLLVSATAVATRSCGSSDEPPSPEPAAERPSIRPQAQAPGLEHGVPVGWSRDAEGARRAAISAVALTGDVARAGFITRADMIGVLATSKYAPTLTRASATQLDELLDVARDTGVAASQVLFRELPLTARGVAVDTSTARVEVWSVLVVGAPELGSPRQAWRTVTVDLAWERDDWRVAGWSSSAGPTPALANNSPITDLAAAERVLAWPTVGGA